jgi:hypothetical protein
MQSKGLKLETKKKNRKSNFVLDASSDGDLLEWYPSQVKGPVDDEVQEGKKSFDTNFSFDRIQSFSSGFNINY